MSSKQIIFVPKPLNCFEHNEKSGGGCGDKTKYDYTTVTEDTLVTLVCL